MSAVKSISTSLPKYCDSNKSFLRLSPPIRFFEIGESGGINPRRFFPCIDRLSQHRLSGLGIYWPHKNAMRLYRVIDVWKRSGENSAIRYRCFEFLNSKRYCVQSADFYRLPLNQKQVSNLDAQFVELFVRQDPSARNAEYPTLEEAIAAHDRYFL